MIVVFGWLRLVPVVLLFLAFWSLDAQAQGLAGLAGYPQCLETRIAAAAPEMDPSDVRAYLDADTPLKAVWECSALIGGVALVPIGLNLLAAFSLIAIVWLGLNFMFTGQLDLGQAISTIFLIGFAYAILDNYHYPSPVATPWGVSSGFPDMIGKQAILLHERLVGDGVSDFADAFIAADDSLSDRQDAGVAALFGDPEDGHRESMDDEEAPASETLSAIDNILTSLWRRGMVWFFSVVGKAVLWIIGWVIYAQYLWGFFALSVLTLIGPIFVPFLVLSQFDFLFWGWFKAMLTSAIYMITAGVLYVVSTAILLAPIQRLESMPFPTESGGVVAVLGFAIRTYFEFRRAEAAEPPPCVHGDRRFLQGGCSLRWFHVRRHSSGFWSW